MNLNKLQIGDIILGTATSIRRGNHMMLYIGENYIIHSIDNLIYDNDLKVIINGIIVQKLNRSNYFTEIETKKNILKKIITKRFDINIYVIRFKEKNNI